LPILFNDWKEKLIDLKRMVDDDPKSNIAKEVLEGLLALSKITKFSSDYAKWLESKFTYLP
jgi:hypothetical protein